MSLAYVNAGRTVACTMSEYATTPRCQTKRSATARNMKIGANVLIAHANCDSITIHRRPFADRERAAVHRKRVTKLAKCPGRNAARGKTGERSRRWAAGAGGEGSTPKLTIFAEPARPDVTGASNFKPARPLTILRFFFVTAVRRKVERVRFQSKSLRTPGDGFVTESPGSPSLVLRTRGAALTNPRRSRAGRRRITRHFVARQSPGEHLTRPLDSR